ncbi:MAG: helix-turn-helix domain-containing protein [Candidatus Omnitrophica bacterium]|nr:helix-turn-helix domain-containing protein [Candidatus Omnitrophota bacterium]
MMKILNPGQVSELLQVKLSTIYQWTHQDYIPHYKVGRFVRFDEIQIMDWLKKGQCAGRNMRRPEIEL